LLAAWVLEYAVEQGRPLSPTNVFGAYITGCTRDREILHEFGADVFPGREPGDAARTWEEMIVYWRTKMAEQSKLKPRDSR